MSLDASDDVVVRPVTAEGSRVHSVYEETQLFHPLIYAILIVTALVSLVAVGSEMLSENEAADAGAFALFITVFGLGVAANLLVLRTRLAAGELYVALGWVPLFWTRIPVSELSEGRVVEYRPLRDAGGWGMRFGRFEGRACRYWNARGNRGVFIAGPNRRVIIGSQQPELLYRALESEGLGSRQNP